jgi:protein-disulfide isomerase
VKNSFKEPYMNSPRSLSQALARSLAAVLLFSAGWACRANAVDAAAPAAAASGDKVLATVNGANITQRDVEAKIIEQILQRQPTAIESMLGPTIDDKILELEAAKQNLTKDKLLENEVKAKATPVTDAEVDKFFEEKKAQIHQPKEQVVPQIRSYLESQHQQETYGKYLEGLRAKYAVKNLFAEQKDAEEAAKAVTRRPIIESGDAPTTGPASATVTLVEFSDFQCPFCGRVIPAIDGVRKNYADKVKIVFHQYPLTAIHPYAQKAAEAALCAKEQGKFWEMHDLLFKEQDKLEVADLKDKATRAGLKADQFNSCLDGGKMAPKVAAEVDLGNKVGVSGTPTLFLNGKQVQGGAIPYEDLAKAIDKELASAGSNNAKK